MPEISPADYDRIVVFTGAGMSAESGVPTYRGSGGIWHEYDWEAFACQQAFETNPHKVLAFHHVRRKAVLQCKPHAGHFILSQLENKYKNINIITQNIDGMHQRAGSGDVIELHGSLWRARCEQCGKSMEDYTGVQLEKSCVCGYDLRPAIVWFGDSLDENILEEALGIMENCDLFISIGTSGQVWPAAGFPMAAKQSGAILIEINTEANETSHIYDHSCRGKAGDVLMQVFGLWLER
ncbi:MAG: NAD-dependent deacylase [FCB group bacterium]|nr:NAD-dependent deacylase [FCB group bacterium]